MSPPSLRTLSLSLFRTDIGIPPLLHSCSPFPNRYVYTVTKGRRVYPTVEQKVNYTYPADRFTGPILNSYANPNDASVCQFYSSDFLLYFFSILFVVGVSLTIRKREGEQTKVTRGFL